MELSLPGAKVPTTFAPDRVLHRRQGGPIPDQLLRQFHCLPRRTGIIGSILQLQGVENPGCSIPPNPIPRSLFQRRIALQD